MNSTNTTISGFGSEMCACLYKLVCFCTSIESSVLSTGGLRLIMLAVPSNASLSSFKKTPQKGTTYGVGTSQWSGKQEITSEIHSDLKR